MVKRSTFANINYQGVGGNSEGNLNRSDAGVYLKASEDLHCRIDDLEHERDEAIEASCIDTLTNCFNRNYLEIFNRDIFNPIRYNKCVGAIYIDLDGFKPVNDQLGHAIGDELLKEFARFLKSSFRHGEDSVVRIGGDEFLVIYHNFNEDADFWDNFDNKIMTVMEKWGALRSPTIDFLEENLGFRPTFSSGFAIYDGEIDRSFNDTIERADAEMYENKPNKLER